MNWTYFPDGKQKTQSDDGDGVGRAAEELRVRLRPNANLTQMRDKSTDAKIDEYAIDLRRAQPGAKVEEKLTRPVKNTTRFKYDVNGNLLKRTHDKTYAKYTYNTRDLVADVTERQERHGRRAEDDHLHLHRAAAAEDRDEGQRQHRHYDYYLDGLLQHQVEKKANGTVVNEHTFEYDANGNRTKDVGKKQNADNHSAYLDTTTDYTYDPRDRIRKQTKTGHGAGTETYVHDANSNVIEQTVKGIDDHVQLRPEPADDLGCGRRHARPTATTRSAG